MNDGIQMKEDLEQDGPDTKRELVTRDQKVKRTPLNKLIVRKENAKFPHQCSFEKSPYYASLHHSQKNAQKKLITVSVLSIIFMSAEIFGGTVSGSLAIISDAAH
jgi:Co/Zn/Cd efflux system component